MPRNIHPRSVRRLVLMTSGVITLATPPPWKGISYGVSPDQGVVESDDFFNDPSIAQWGCPGRGDLNLMSQMGANIVRLYGNDPRWSHKSFLDSAWSLGLGVIPGISDYPYLQGQDTCSWWGDALIVAGGSDKRGDCHANIKESYLENLQKGFMVKGSYHWGLEAMIAVNEPDLKLGSHPKHWAKAVISAIDGMLSAEDAAGMKDPELKITATVSFSICTECEVFSDKPGLGQMWTLRDAMQHPDKYGYKPLHDLAAFYETRFINSFNTGNMAAEIEDLFLNTYSKDPDGFPGQEVFIAEYHSPSEPVQEDLNMILEIASRSKELIGVSFFEWINRHDEGGHTDWGMFDLGHLKVTTMNYNGSLYDIRCLMPSKDAIGKPVPVSVAKAFGGMYSVQPPCNQLRPKATMSLR